MFHIQALNRLHNLGRFFYRHRGVIPVPFFILLVIFAGEPRFFSIFFIFVGMGLRIWAVGYLGPIARGSEFYGKYRIENGPFGILKHPMYTGNFFLVCGTVVLFNPPVWLAILVILSFIVEYSIIVGAENRYIRGVDPKKAKFRLGNVRTEWPTILILVFVYIVAEVRSFLFT